MPDHFDPSPRVTFATPDHDDAFRVRAVLEALDFDVVRVVPEDEYDDDDALTRAADRMRSRYRLREAEFALVWGVLEELDSEGLASVVGRALAPTGAVKAPNALKWVSRSLFGKLGLVNGDRAGLVALVEGLKDQREGTSFVAVRRSEALAKQVHAEVCRAAQALGMTVPPAFETLSWLVTYAGRVADRVEQVMSERRDAWS